MRLAAAGITVLKRPSRPCGLPAPCLERQVIASVPADVCVCLQLFASYRVRVDASEMSLDFFPFEILMVVTCTMQRASRNPFALDVA